MAVINLFAPCLLIFAMFFCKMNSSLQLFIIHNFHDAQHQDARFPLLATKTAYPSAD